jgi:SAM-dependent methyltransferase
MSAEAGPGGFDTIVSRPDYYIEFLDARTAIDDETRVKQVITGLLQARDGVEVLDVGAGTGDDARALAALVAPHGKVVGVDRSPDMIAEARHRAEVRGSRSSLSKAMRRRWISRTRHSTGVVPSGYSSI